MIRGTTAALLLLVLECAAVPALGWGACGHRIVGEIAERHLDPAAKAGTAALLGDRTLADVAGWADRVRETERYSWTRPLHYVNLPEDATSYQAERDCPDDRCVVEGIARFSEELVDPETSRGRRVVALKFLIHLVGDIHQPLHVSRASDLGGNLITVTHREKRKSLHRVWDTELLDCASGEWKARAVEIDRRSTRTGIEIWPASKPSDWAEESWSLARSHAYALPPSGVIDNAYLKRNEKVVEARLYAAAVRLADLLGRLLSAQPD